MTKLTVGLVTLKSLEPLAPTLECLLRQSARDQLEIVIVIDDASAVRPSDLPKEISVQLHEIGSFESLDGARAAVVPFANSPWIAFLEDHAYPKEDWAEELMAELQGDYDAVGPCFTNPNPNSILSWVNFQAGYGEWIAPVESGAVPRLPGHNVAYRTSKLRQLGLEHDLSELMSRGGDLHAILEQEGPFLLAGRARVAHLNPSSLSSTLFLRLRAGRLYAARRARSWSLGKRLMYFLGSPLIPMARLWRDPGKGLSARRRLAKALGFILDAVGQGVGYLFGQGRALEELEWFEWDRKRHLSTIDRRRWEKVEQNLSSQREIWQ